VCNSLGMDDLNEHVRTGANNIACRHMVRIQGFEGCVCPCRKQLLLVRVYAEVDRSGPTFRKVEPP
jgi:hypothetical protein